MLLKEILIKFNEDMAFQYQPKTLARYCKNVEKFFEFCSKDFDKVTKKDVKKWVAYLSASGKKPLTVRYYLRSLKALYIYCMDEEIISVNVTSDVKGPKIRPSKPRYLEQHELLELQEVAKPFLRDRVVIDVLYYTGVRVSELLNITIDDINFDEQEIWIRKGKGLKERFVFFTPECGERIKEYLNSRTDGFKNLIVDSYGRLPIVDPSAIFHTY